MEKRTIEQLEAALNAVSNDLAPRVEELAAKSTEGTLTPEEHREYAEAVRMNDMLSLLKLETVASDAIIVGLTPEGRATVLLLEINEEGRVRLRKHIMRQSRLP